MVEATFVQRSACLTQENMGAFQIDIQLEFFSTFFLLIATGKPCSSFVTFSASLVCVCVCVYDEVVYVRLEKLQTTRNSI